MWSCIFQIETSKEAVLNNRMSVSDIDENFHYNDGFGMTNCWREDISWLMDVLPEGCFELEEVHMPEDTDESKWYAKIKMIKKPEDFIRNWYDEIMKFAADKFTYDNFKEIGWLQYMFKETIENNFNPIGVYSHDRLTDYLAGWLKNFCMKQEVGQEFYVGGIIDYHF